MPDMAYIVAAFGLTYGVLAGYAFRLRRQRRRVLAADAREGRNR